MTRTWHRRFAFGGGTDETIRTQESGGNPVLAYLASPYTHDNPGIVLARFHLTCEAAGDLLRAGHHVLSPIAHTHPIAVQCGLPGNFDWYEAYDYALIDHCDEVWVLMLDGWRTSRGVTKEVAHARARGKPVRWVFADTLEVVDCDPDEAGQKGRCSDED
jgi:nucleoside 2-deoxyribosyltransferase